MPRPRVAGLMDVTGFAQLQPVNIRNGIPCCPCCNEPMIQVGENEWQCALGVALWRWVRERLDDAQ
ncbi:MAG TPA: hypothetical protein VG276_28055 [Actinomycetes bacterium]|nr:hypothetical protein [Actinomycetes bacterium]